MSDTKQSAEDLAILEQTDAYQKRQGTWVCRRGLCDHSGRLTRRSGSHPDETSSASASAPV